MKSLRIIFIVLSGIVVVFLGIGMIVPSYEYELSIVANANPAKCWAAFHDAKKMNAWLDGFESLTLKGGVLLSPGSTYEIIINENGHRMIMTEKIVEVSVPNRIVYELNNDVLKSEFSYAFEGSTSTRITSKYKIAGNSIVWKSILFLSKSYMTRSAQAQLEKLKKVIETNESN